MARATSAAGQQAFPGVRIASGTAFELAAELAAWSSGPARASLESGKAWIRDVREFAGPELLRRVDAWTFPQFAELVPIALEMGPPHTPERLVARLRSLPPAQLQRRLLGAESPMSRAMVSDGAFDRALAGDAAAVTELRRVIAMDAQQRRGIDRLLATPATELRDELAVVVEAWAELVSPAFADRSMDLVQRDIEPKEGLLRVTSARDALRVFTNGVDNDPAGWAAQIVVIPTVAMRPFMSQIESGSTLIVLCSVADEAFDADPAAPPRRLVQSAAALGDEVRLRVLRELSGGELEAKQLAARLGVDRTTLYAHLGILRSAGLVSVRAEGVQCWRYALRADGLERATAALAGYLRLSNGWRGT